MRFIERALAVPAFIMLLSSCTPAYKARLDMTASGGIVWPEQPEKPRIKYLWSLSDVAGYGGGAEGFITGRTSDDPSDPQSSGRLLRPQGIYADGRRLYIADAGAARVTVVDRANMDVIHITEADGGSLEFPRSVVADSLGNIYVSDADLKKIIAYSPEGKFMRFFDGELRRPSGLAIDSTRGIIYAVDTDSHEIYVYDTSGKIVRRFGAPGRADGEFHYPTYITTDRQGNIYVTDFLNFRVQVFSAELKFLYTIGRLGDSYDTLDKPKGVAVDTEGHIYVVDGARQMIKIFGRDGRLLLFFGEQGSRYGDFYLPAGIFIDSSNTLYIADSLNGRIQAFQFLGGQ